MSADNETKNNFAYAFVDLLEFRSVGKITITELCAYANYSRETFYYHFKDKYDLMSWIYYAQIYWHMDKYYGTEAFYITISRIEKGMKSLENFYVSFFQDHRYSGVEDEMIEHSNDIYTDLVKLALDEQELSEKMKFLIQYNAAGSVYMVKYWMTRHSHVSHREFTQLLMDSISPELLKIFNSYERAKK